jgi:hypothetical protein
MPRIRRAYDLVPGVPTRAPLGRLSCPHSNRAVAGPADENRRCHDAFRAVETRDAGWVHRSGDPHASARCGDADPWHLHRSPTTDYRNPPTSERQHVRQRILAVIVALILAAILAQAGW